MDYIRIKNPNYHFGERLSHLMELAGINLNSKKPGPDRLLLDMILQNNLISLNTEEWIEDKETVSKYESRKKYDYTKVISGHRKTASATKISGEWLDRYCKVFNCDSDYLFGYIDTPSREVTDISVATGLSEKSVKLFTDYKKRHEKVKAWKKELPQESSLHMRTRFDIEKRYSHVPHYLIDVIEALLNSCYTKSDSNNIFDLIYKYVTNVSLENVDIVYNSDMSPQGITRKNIASIKPDTYDKVYLDVNQDPFNNHKLSDLVEEAQVRSILNKLSEIRTEYLQKEGTNNGKR